jgi:hypothetical protein
MIGRVLALAGITGLLVLIFAMTATADPSPDTWARLRACESGGNYTIVSANGRYYGAYQFNLGTWTSVGGTGRPNQATPGEQDYRALYLYRMRGWQPWTCATTLGLKPDADAASKRAPTHTDSAKMATDTVPPWPGKVYQDGDCAPALRTWQLRMNTYGYTFEGTGCYHDKTRAAVLALQRANGIKDSGLLGPKTWTAAWTGTPPPHP